MANCLQLVLPLLAATALFQAAGVSTKHQRAESSDHRPEEEAVRLPKNAAFIRLPMEIRANAPFVQVKVNGRGPFNFEVDTGSMTSPVASELSKQMGLDPAKEGKDEQTVNITLAEGLKVPIPASFASFEGLWPLLGRKIYGDIGYGVLKHFVVEFDYEGKTLTLYDPLRYRYAGPGQSFESSLLMGYDPQIAGDMTIPGGPPIPVKFTLDTGAGGTVISAPLVNTHELLERVTQKVPNPPSNPLVDGVNGATFDTITGRIPSISLGTYTVAEPLVALSRDADGVFAMDNLGVNLGSNILRRFKVIVDYPHQRVILEPNSHFHDPFPADASGLVLSATGSHFATVVVHGVVTGSPADRSGLRPGDIILAIDGEPVKYYALWQIQDLFRDSGRERRLTIKRANSTTTLTVKLRALV
jgi:PDZ domain-containing protein/aspartyl protease